MAEKKIFKPTTPVINNRAQKRLDIRRSDGHSAAIKFENGTKLFVLAYDLNSFGASIVFSDIQNFRISTGEKIEIDFKLADGIVVLYLAKICWKTNAENGFRCGLEFVEQLSPYPTLQILNQGLFPLILPEYFSLVGFYYKPYQFFERGNIKVLEISEKIWKIVFFDSDIILFKSQKLDIWLLEVDQKISPVGIEILSIDKEKNGQVVANCYIRNISKKNLEWIARQLIFVCELTPVEIRRIGFDTDQVSNGFRFRFVKTQEEYEKVLALRYKSYLEAGKINTNKSIWDMVASLDHKSRIMICYHGEKVVASVSISFPTSNDEILDTERAFPNGYPQSIPNKDQIVEIARLCTDSDYRRTDLLNRVFEYTYKVTICGDRKYILTSTDSKLWKIYKKLGFKKTGMSYPHPYLSGLEHHIILGERAQPDMGKNISPLAWNYLWKDMNIFMESNGFVKKNFLQKIKIKIFIFIGKVLKIQTNKYY